MKFKLTISRIALVALAFQVSLLQVSSVSASDRFANVSIESQWVAGNVSILYGSGGNIGALTGPDGILIIDDQFEPLAPKIEASLAKLSSKDLDKVSYVVNTHYHGDHTGGNVYFSKSASVLAHENVRKRLAAKGTSSGLPVITYQDGVKLHINGETVHVRHLASGHTDGDSVVYFEKANVWHLGDLLFEKRFPYIDLEGGGSVSGYIKNLTLLLTQIDDKAKVIPGHGQLTDKSGIHAVLQMIESTYAQVREMKQRGLTQEQVMDKGLGSQWRNWSWAFIDEAKWIKTLYASK